MVAVHFQIQKKRRESNETQMQHTELLKTESTHARAMRRDSRGRELLVCGFVWVCLCCCNFLCAFLSHIRNAIPLEKDPETASFKKMVTMDPGVFFTSFNVDDTHRHCPDDFEDGFIEPGSYCKFALCQGAYVSVHDS